MQGTMLGARRRGRPRTAWMDNIKTWTGLSVEESVRMTEDRDNRRKYVHGVANPRIEVLQSVWSEIRAYGNVISRDSCPRTHQSGGVVHGLQKVLVECVKVSQRHSG